MAQTRDQLRARVADETAAGLRRITRRLEQAGASAALTDQARALARLAAAELAGDEAKRAAEIDELASAPAEPGWVKFYTVQDNGDLLLTCHDPAGPGRDVIARVTQFELDTWLIASRPPGGTP
jgi:hypothetical protein